MIPSIIKTQMRLEQQAQKAKTTEEAAAIQVQKATITSGMPATPAQQIMSSVVAQQQRQAAMQKVNAKAVAKKLQLLYSSPSAMLSAQREQIALQEESIKAKIKLQQQEAEYAAIAPKETVQNSEQQEYTDLKRIEMLEKIYNALPPKKKFNLQQLLGLRQFNQPLQDYPGGFVDPNYDKQLRPLGRDTTKITEF